ncbi:MAG TPA: DUF2007 domain-containing protein [Trueperaceae bacterium]|mgnify:CR=1 FL=1|nr:DUF2007 domain-containing protein [Trueperaceae bacterium]
MTEGRSMKGETVIVNGDEWVVVDEAPAAALADMVAALLEDEGFVVMVRGLDLQSDAFSHLGSTNITATHVLVPKDQAEAAMRLIAETVTDYQGEELDELMERLARGEVVEGFEPGDEGDDEEDEDDPGLG